MTDWARHLFRRIVEESPVRWVLCLAALGGSARMLQKWADLGDSTTVGKLVLFGSFLVAPALGVVALYVRARLLYWSGQALGGRATPTELRAAIAWAEVPGLMVAPLLLPRVVAAFGGETASDHGRLASLAFVANPVATVAMVVVAVLFLAEAQVFSVWRAIANEALASLLGIALVASGLGLGYGLYRLTA